MQTPPMSFSNLTVLALCFTISPIQRLFLALSTHRHFTFGLYICSFLHATSPHPELFYSPCNRKVVPYFAVSVCSSIGLMAFSLGLYLTLHLHDALISFYQAVCPLYCKTLKLNQIHNTGFIPKYSPNLK